jgi:hypothetical protein
LGISRRARRHLRRDHTAERRQRDRRQDGAVLNAIRFLHPVLTAAVGSLGAVTAAAAMPPGSPKQ